MQAKLEEKQSLKNSLNILNSISRVLGLENQFSFFVQKEPGYLCGVSPTYLILYYLPIVGFVRCFLFY